MGRSRAGILAQGLVVVAVLFPMHFFAERPSPTPLSTGLVLLLFFVPPALAAARLEAPRGGLPGQAAAYLGFGFVLGVLAGLVGGAEKAILHLLTGEPFPISLRLWGAVALLFALASGLAYGVLLGLARGLAALLRQPAPEPLTALFSGLPPSLASALLSCVVPGLGHVALGLPARGRPFLLAAVTAGLAGLLIGIAGMLLLVEGGLPTLPVLVLGAALLLLPVVLVPLAALDLLYARSSAPQPDTAP